MKLWALAALAAATTSSIVASPSRPYMMFSLILHAHTPPRPEGDGDHSLYCRKPAEGTQEQFLSHTRQEQQLTQRLAPRNTVCTNVAQADVCAGVQAVGRALTWWQRALAPGTQCPSGT